jgi:predicted lipoprotein with Yx(FWY)xxD motif
MKLNRASFVPVVVVALALAATALGQSGSGPSKHASVHSAASATVSTKTTSLGTVLVTGSGKTLYLDVNDKTGHPACKGGCLTIWPPLKASGTLKASGRAKTAELGTIKLAGGIKQVTYNKHPLYTFASAATGTSGEGENGFYVVSPSGSKVTKASSTTSSTTTTSTGGGYGY